MIFHSLGHPGLRLGWRFALVCCLGGLFRALGQINNCVPAGGDLVAWYRLEGTPEDTVGRYPGVNLGDLSYVAGPLGNNVQFGKQSAIRIGNAPGLRPPKISVALWIKSTTPGTYRYAISKSLDRFLADSYGLYSSSDGKLRFYVTHRLSPLEVSFSAPASISVWDNQWHWVVGTYDEKNVFLYVDGKPTGTGNPGYGAILYGTSYFNGDLFIGNGEVPTPTPRVNLQWPGQIDEVQFFNRALSGEEIANRFAQNAPGYCIPEGRPIFVSLPVSQRFKVGQPLTLSATASGVAPLQFQWRKNGTPIPGATASQFMIAAADIDDGGNYQIEVSNALGTMVSDPVLILPDLVVLLADDLFLRAGGFSGPSGTGVTDNRLASLEAGEPLHANRRGGHSIWLRYLATETGLMTLSTRGSDFDTLLGVYEGNSVNLLTAKAASDDEPERVTSRVSFPVRTGRTYRVAIDGRAGAMGTIVFRWNLQPTAAPLLDMVRQPVSRTVSLGGLATFNISALAAKSYQWFHNGIPLGNDARLTGTTEAQLVIQQVGLSDLGLYEVEVTDGLSQVRSERVSLQLNPALGVAGAVDTFGVADKLADVIDDLGVKLPGAARAGGRPLPSGLASGTSGTQIFNSFGATAEPGEPVHCGVGSGHSQWFAYQAVADGLMVFDTVGSTFDTVLAIYRDTGTGVGVYDGLLSIGCNNDATPALRTSRVVVSVEKDTVYYIAIDSVAGNLPGTAVLNYQAFSGTRLGVRSPTAAGDLQLTVEGVTGAILELQSSAKLGDWSTVLTTNSPADQYALKLLSNGRSAELFRAIVR